MIKNNICELENKINKLESSIEKLKIGIDRLPTVAKDATNLLIDYIQETVDDLKTQEHESYFSRY